MTVRHKNDYGKTEILDGPLSDCACNGCSRARRNENRSNRSAGIGRAIRGAAAAGSIAATIHGAAVQPEQQSGNTQRGYGESSRRAEGEQRGVQASDATRDKGRGRGTNQR